MQDLWAGHRELLNRAIARLIDDPAYHSGELVREQIEASDEAGYQPAALACLAAAEAVGGSAEDALPGAVAIGLMSQMAVVFTGLENSGGVPSLSTAWGMPRSLNAGDAMFALAQESLQSASDRLSADVRLRCTATLDKGARQLVETLLAAEGRGDTRVTGQKALLPAAMSLGGLLAGANQADVSRLEALGSAWAELGEEELTRMLASEPNSWLAT